MQLSLVYEEWPTRIEAVYIDSRMPASCVGGNLIRWFHDPENGTPPTCSGHSWWPNWPSFSSPSGWYRTASQALRTAQDYLFVMLKSRLDSQKGVMCRPDERLFWADLISPFVSLLVGESCVTGLIWITEWSGKMMPDDQCAEGAIIDINI